MKIQYVSDLHLEFPGNREYLIKNPIEPACDYLVIAGDLGYFDKRRRSCIYNKDLDKFLNYFNKNWKKTIIVPGNHEYYLGCPINKIPYRYNIRDNVQLLNNTAVMLQEKDAPYDLMVYGTTLWSAVSPSSYHDVFHGMNDYKYINYMDKVPFSPGLAYDLHMRQIFSLNTYLLPRNIRLRPPDFTSIDYVRKPYKLVIVSHHGCHPKCKTESQRVNTSLNDAYFTDLSETINFLKPEAWIYGHTHENKSFKVDSTTIATNALGYIDYGVNEKFNPSSVIDI